MDVIRAVLKRHYLGELSEAEVVSLIGDIVDQSVYRAKIFGWELMDSSQVYWNVLLERDNQLMISDKYHTGDIHTQLTKHAWGSLGINDQNAIFERVD